MKSYLLLIIFSLTFWINAFALVETDRQEATTQNYYGANSGFENGIKDITVSGATKNWSTTKHLGNKAVSCSTTTTNQYCETKLVCNTGETANWEWGFFYKSTSTTLKAEILDSSNNVIRKYTSGTTEVIPSQANFNEMILEWPSVASTCYKLRFTQTTATASTIYWDTMHVSKYMNVGSVNLQDKRYDVSSYLTGTSPGALSSVSYAWGIPYKDRDNNWRIKGNIKVTYGSNATSTNMTFTGIDIGANAIYYTCGNDASATGCIGQFYSTNNVQCSCPTTHTRYYHTFDIPLAAMPTWATDFGASQVVKMENANQFGEFTMSGGACEFIGTAASLTVMSKSGTCLYAYSGNASAGTVDKTEFVTPTLQPGTYEVSMDGAMICGNASTNCGYDIYDGTNTIAYLYEAPAGCAQSTLKGQVTYTSVQNSKTLQFRVKRTAGSSNCYLSCGTVSNPTCKFSIKPVYPTSNVSQIIQSVGTTYQGQKLIDSVMFAQGNITTVCSSSPCSLYNNSGIFSGVTRSNTGRYPFTFTQTLNYVPNCWCNNAFYGSVVGCSVRSLTTSGGEVQVYSGSYSDDVVTLFCDIKK